jgi:hypothetical protein
MFPKWQLWVDSEYSHWSDIVHPNVRLFDNAEVALAAHERQQLSSTRLFDQLYKCQEKNCTIDFFLTKS